MRRAAIALAVLAGAAWTAAAPARQASTAAVSIQERITAASAGDVVTIPAGLYREQVIIDRSITLRGEGRPVIDAEGRGDVVVITASGATIRGFEIRGSASHVSDEPAGIRAKGDRATIEDNLIHEVLFGIVLVESHGHTVRNNEIRSISALTTDRRGHGLYLWYSNDNLIEGNRIHDTRDGIFLGFAGRNRITGNSVTESRYGVHYMYSDENELTGNRFSYNVAGGALMYADRLLLRDNEFAHNQSEATGYGLLFKDVDNVEMTGNLVHHNRLGMVMDGAPFSPGASVVLKGNLIGYNQVALELFTTTNVTFTENTFAGNLRQIESRGGSLEKKNRWSLDGRGNYWDDYEGYDADGDGVGDITYRYQGAFDELVSKNEAIRAWDHTPARMALDLAARWFPAYQPDPRAIDPAPLMGPTMSLAGEATGTEAALGLAFAATLVVGSAAILVGAGRSTGRRRWARC